MNKVRVTVCGRDFVVQTDETADYIEELGKKTEAQIEKLMKVSPSFTPQNAAILTALIALDEAHKAEESIDNIRTQIKNYVDEAGEARSEKEALSRTVKELVAQNAELRAELDELKKANSVPGDQLVLENTVTPAVTVLAAEAEKSSRARAPKSEPVSNATVKGAENGTVTDSGTEGAGCSCEDGVAPYENNLTDSSGYYQVPGQISLTEYEEMNAEQSAASKQTRKGRKKKR